MSLRKHSVGVLALLAGVGSARDAHAQDQKTEPEAAPPAETAPAPTAGSTPIGESRSEPTTPSSEPTAPAPVVAAAEPDVRTAVPNLAYAYTAYGAYAKTLGAQAYGLGLGASGQRGIIGGGITVWGAPIDRLTIIGDGQRNSFGDFAPSLAVVVRILGKPGSGWSFGGLGKFKIEGFAAGPKHDEVESEVEIGTLLSYNDEAWHLDVNTIGGMGTGDDGEVDVEGRLRFGRDVGEYFRLGVDGQARVRLAGPKYLPNGEIWDFAVGPQALLGSRHFFGSLTGGPTTTGLLSDRVGWNVLLALGGTTF